ncbi:hypothetical protein PINS_up005338 [Pythium insidiosum]|nr:hypothetical protein PINS_up005338 [Pythium insidiosum]
MPQRVDVSAATPERCIDIVADEDALRTASTVEDDAVSPPFHRLHTPTTQDDASSSSSMSARKHDPQLSRRPVRRRMVMFGGISTIRLPSRVEEEGEEEDDDGGDDDNDDHDNNGSDAEEGGDAGGGQDRGSGVSSSDGRSVESSVNSTVLLSDSQRWFPRIDLHRDLHWLSNRFRDERTEESYQLYSSMNDFPVARRVLLFMVLFQIAAYLLFICLHEACLGPTSSSSSTDFAASLSSNAAEAGAQILRRKHGGCRRYKMPDIDRDYLILLWAFAPVGLLYSLFPIKFLENTMRLRIVVYYIRRRWKAIAAFIVLLWAIGLDVFLHKLLFAVRDQRQKMLNDGELSCAKNNSIPEDWHAASKWRTKHASRKFMSVSYWVLVYQAKITSSIIMGVLAVVATLAGIVSVAVKLDFRHVLFNSASLWITTLGILTWGPSFSLNSRSEHNRGNAAFMFLCVLFPTVLTLLATYSEDRASRMAYASRVRAERINTTLKLDLSLKRMGLENRIIPKDERDAIEQALASDSDSRALRLVSIPFCELSLKDVITKNPFGEVLLADYHGTQVVLKRLAHSVCTPDGLKDYKARVEMLSMLRHPNIVLFIGATFDNVANVGIVFEYLERGDVYALLRSNIALSWSDPLLKIATDVALGVSYLHNCDPPLVHRDLKSSNLLCTATYSCKISDFGESKRLVGGEGLFSTIVGTPYWLAPEVLREEKYSVQVDCYSFGVVLIELETRRDPYYDASEKFNTIDIMLRVARGDLRPTIPVSCGPRRRDLIMRCLDADPSRRPKMTEILSALQNEVRQEVMDVTAFDDSRDRRRVMLMQRHQRLNRRGVKDLLVVENDDSDTE